MTHRCHADGCGRPVEDAWVCQTCADELRDWLARVPWLVVQLEIVRSRLVRYADPIGAHGSGRDSLPYDPRATEAIWVLRSSLVGWVRLVAEESGESLPSDHLDAMAAWLRAEVEFLRHHRAGGEAIDEIGAAVRNAEIIVDRPAEKWFAGPCDECLQDVYAETGHRWVTCGCGAIYDSAERREWLLGAVVDVLANATEISRALTTLEAPVTADRIRQWRSRGQIAAHARDAHGSPLYRIGDVLELLAKRDGLACLR